jgi:hypothetical protein
VTARGRVIIRVLLVLVALGPPLVHARAFINMFALPGNIEVFTDALTYQRAGDRLNAGHDLYRLQEGDEPVLTIPGVFSAPLLSPPPIAVLWRPIAALPFGLAAWLVACLVALLGTMAYLVWRTGVIGAAVCLILAEPVGNQLAVGNMTSFFPLLTVLVWNLRSRLWSGALVGVMAALKLSPGALFASRHLIRRRDQLVAGFVAIAAVFAFGILGSGPAALMDYVGVARSTQPSLPSLSGTFGIPWLSLAVLVGGSLLALVPKHLGLSFSIALVASVLGNPALYEPGYVPLLALVAPLIGSRYVWPRVDSAVRPSTEPRNAPSELASEAAG